LRRSILMALFFSVLIYGIRIAGKLSMSNFHLSSDAAERCKLIEAYLALLLKNKDSIGEGGREDIIKGLFARSETGLLKEDAKPVVPGIEIAGKNISSGVTGV
ncbi:DUF6161 domain-containing protein, partial [Planctomycetota bacterium]